MGGSRFIWASSPMDHGTPKPEGIMDLLLAVFIVIAIVEFFRETK